MKTNTIIIGILMAVLIISVSLSIFRGENIQHNVVKSTGAVVADKSSHDFGEIDIFDGKVSTDYILTNSGSEDVIITGAVTSCMCTEGTIGGLTFGMHSGSGDVVIPAGGSEILTATFDPLAHGPDGTGKIKRELILTTNSETTAEVVVTLAAEVYKK